MTGAISGGDTGAVDAYDLLGHPLRRQVLFELPNYDNPVRLSALADGIRSSEMLGVTTGHDDTGDTDAIRTKLHHVHLPKFAAVGWVVYDSDNRTVRYGPRIEIIRSALQTTLSELDRVRAAYDERTAELNSRQE